MQKIREKSFVIKSELRWLHRLFRGGKCGKEGGNGIRTRGNAL